MSNHKIYNMSFQKVMMALIAKAERKSQKREDVLSLAAWLTGYSQEQMKDFQEEKMSYGDFFRQAPSLNSNRDRIKGKICGVQIETIEDPLMQEIRRLDKLVDELAKGNSIDQIIQRYGGLDESSSL